MIARSAKCPVVSCAGGAPCGDRVTRLATVPCCGRVIAACAKHAKTLSDHAGARLPFLGMMANPCPQCGSRREHPVPCSGCGRSLRGVKIRWVSA